MIKFCILRMIHETRIEVLWIVAALIVVLAPSESSAELAFPGAEGFGSGTRGAYELFEQTGDTSDLPTVIHVTNLDDSGDGSFREAMSGSGPRVIVFDVGGAIQLESNIVLWDENYLTIAGQTAPGDGICITDYYIQFRNSHDIIIRGLRIRGVNDGDALGFRPENFGTSDRCYNIVVDHCSFSWTDDEILSNFGAGDHMTFSNNILYGPLGPHNHGSLIGPGSQYFTLKQNLWSSTIDRSPGISGGISGGHEPGATYIESINNITYNSKWWGPQIVAGNGRYNGIQNQLVAIVGNYDKAGPDTYLTSGSPEQYTWNIIPEEPSMVYISGNLTPKRQDHDQDDWDVCNDSACSEGRRTDTWPFETSGVTVFDAGENFDHLITNDSGMDGSIPRIGAYPRDSHDARAIEEAASGSDFLGTEGRRYDSIPTIQDYASGTMTDSDDDGMPDAWESTHGLEPSDPDDAHTDANGDGYTNLEGYINSFFTPYEPPVDPDADADIDADADGDGNHDDGSPESCSCGAVGARSFGGFSAALSI